MTRAGLLLGLSATLVLLSLALGGGNSMPGVSMTVALAACALLATSLIGVIDGRLPAVTIPALVLLVLLCGLPLLQLVPLGASTWQALPGRQVPSAILHLVGEGAARHPLSLDPERTKLRAIALIAPAAMFLAALQLDRKSRTLLVRIIVVVAFGSAILGALQVALGGLYVFPVSQFGYPVGLFSNRNHEADLLLLGIALAPVTVGDVAAQERMRRLFITGIVLFFAVAVVATKSRTAIVILPFMLFGTALATLGKVFSRSGLVAVGLIVLASLLGTLIVFNTPIGAQALSRFNDIGSDARPVLWQSTILAIRQQWPFGSGLGSFVAMYQTIEDLNSVVLAYANNAHNDYLEIVLETGLAGVVLLTAYGCIFLSRILSRFPRTDRVDKWCAVSGITAILCHSMTDYPLRTSGLLVVFAFLHGLLYPSLESVGVGSDGGSRPSRVPAEVELRR